MPIQQPVRLAKYVMNIACYGGKKRHEKQTYTVFFYNQDCQLNSLTFLTTLKKDHKQSGSTAAE